MTRQSYRAWLVALALLGVCADQASKYIVFGWLYQHPAHYDSDSREGNFVLIPGAFRLYVQYTGSPASGTLRGASAPQLPHVNRGALFGLGNDGKKIFGHTIEPGDANYFFAFVSVLAAIAIVTWSFRATTSGDRLLCLALGLILGGTLGNLYDRIVFNGVRDFLYWSYLVNWPVFNVADCCLVVGAFLLLAQAFLTSPAPGPAPNPESIPEPMAVSPQPVPAN